MKHAFRLAAVAGFAAMALWGAAPAARAETPAWLTCPDEIALDVRPEANRERERIREIAPTAGAVISPELFSHARFASAAYALYAAFDAGEDPRQAFAAPGLTLAAVIYGDPGRETDRRVQSRDTHTLYGFVADETASGRRYIVFRGTQQPAEWVRNAQVRQRPYPSGTPARAGGAKVHAGFLEIFDSLTVDRGAGERPFAAELPGLINGRPTIFVGHSLGSALATLAGVEASRRAPAAASALRIVTLASPRVGDPGFAAMTRSIGRIDRVCNLVDVVTAVPPSTPDVRYVHVGTPYRVSSFDWPSLANDLEKRGEQILCWHGDTSYSYMLDPAQAGAAPAQCAKAQ